MKSNKNLKLIVLITLLIFFALAIIITINLSLITSDKNVNNFDPEKLRTAEISGKIHIDNNWTDAWDAGICTGNGTYSEPYVIEDVVIDAGGSGSGILIENSNVYFKIENCTLYGTESGPNWGAGIRLVNVSNSQLIGNNYFSNYLGIDISDGSYNNTITGNILNNNGGGIEFWFSYNNTFSGNTVNNSIWAGMYVIGSSYINISRNTVNNNGFSGIYLAGSNYTSISRNTVNDNSFHGIEIYGSKNNTISRNTMNKNNWSGICLIDSIYNIISGNNADYNNQCGIFLFENSNYNIISGNTVNYNRWGIILYNSYCNTVSGNKLIGNEECIAELNCQGNLIQANDCKPAPSLAYFPIVLTIIIPIVVVSVFIIYQNRKRFRKPQEDLEFL